MTDCNNNYDDQITVVAKPSVPTYTKTAKPYTVNPGGLVTEDCNALLNEDGSQLLMEIT